MKKIVCFSLVVMLLYPFAVFMLCASLKAFALLPAIDDRCPQYPRLVWEQVCDRLTTPTGYVRYDCVKAEDLSMACTGFPLL